MLTLIATLLIAIWGLSYFTAMSKREDPEIKIRGARVVTVFPGALPEDVEQYVTKPIEDVAAEIGEVSEISSESRAGISVIIVMLEDSTPVGSIDQIWDRLRNKIDRIRDTLPEGCYDPFVDDEFFETCSHIICLSGESYTPRELTAFAERIKNRLSSLNDAGTVTVWADRPERIYLEYDPQQVSRYYGADLGAIMAAVGGTNALMPGGTLELQGNTYALDSSGGFDSLNDIEDLPVYGTPGGAQVRLGDLGDLRYGYEEPPSYLARVNGRECVLVSVIMKDGKNVLNLGRQVDTALAELRQSLPADLAVDVVQDQPWQVSLRINSFLKNLYTGIALVILVVFLFMGFRPSVPVGLAIPLVIIATFAVLSMLGTSLQQMSIAGLIIALGMLVDNAIVVTDNVSRFIDRGFERKQAAIQATKELALPMLTSTLTTVCAFLPLALLPGETGDFVIDIPLVVSTAILVSYVIAITVTPAICSLVLRPTTGTRTFQPLDPLMKLIERMYPPVLRWTQQHMPLTLAIVLTAFAGALALFPQLGVQFFPGAERNQFAIDIRLADGSSIEETRGVVEQIEAELATHDDVTSCLANIGQGGPMYYYNRITQSSQSNYADLLVNTVSPEATARLVPRLRRALQAQVAGARIEVKMLEQGPPVGAPIQIKLRGENLNQLKSLGRQVSGILTATPNVIDVRDSFGEDSRQLLLELDETQLRAIGNTRQDVNKLTLLASTGLQVTEYRAPSRTIPVLLRSFAANRDSALDLEQLYLYNKYTGNPVPISSVGHYETVNVTSRIQRTDRERELTISGYLSGGRLASEALSQDIKPALAEIKLPPGYELKISGEAEESGEAFGNLGAFALIALLLIVLILVAQFKSVRISLVVFLAIPLALIGAVLGLFFSGWPFGFTAGMGVVSLAGIVINNSIVLMDFIMEKLRRGRPLDKAIDEAGQERLRPILLTTATTIGGLLPLGLFGGSMWAPMAFAIIGGLIVSTLLTLIVVPLLFRLVAAKRALALVAIERAEEAEAD
ncbi:efflux RND transporter permease subunit [bacterium]|nr:efflux RND transporter permease subunit [bacterium]